MNIKGRGLEKICIKHISDKELVSKICKESLKLNNTKANNPVKNMQKFWIARHPRKYSGSNKPIKW